GREAGGWSAGLGGGGGVAGGGLAAARVVEPLPSPGGATTPTRLPAPPVVAAKPDPEPELPSDAPSHNLDGGFSISRQLGLGVSRIVIDPGHGGHDPGAKGGGTTEAELVLDVSLRLAELLAKVPGLEIVLSRKTDYYVA